MGMLTTSVTVSIPLRTTMGGSLRSSLGRSLSGSLSCLILAATLRSSLAIGTLNNACSQGSIELIARIATSASIGIGNPITERVDSHTFLLQMIKVKSLVALGTKPIATNFAVGIRIAGSCVILIDDALVVLEDVAVVAGVTEIVGVGFAEGVN